MSSNTRNPLATPQRGTQQADKDTTPRTAPRPHDSTNSRNSNSNNNNNNGEGQHAPASAVSPAPTASNNRPPQVHIQEEETTHVDAATGQTVVRTMTTTTTTVKKKKKRDVEITRAFDTFRGHYLRCKWNCPLEFDPAYAAVALEKGENHPTVVELMDAQKKFSTEVTCNESKLRFVAKPLPVKVKDGKNGGQKRLSHEPKFGIFLKLSRPGAADVEVDSEGGWSVPCHAKVMVDPSSTLAAVNRSTKEKAATQGSSVSARYDVFSQKREEIRIAEFPISQACRAPTSTDGSAPSRSSTTAGHHPLSDGSANVVIAQNCQIQLHIRSPDRQIIAHRQIAASECRKRLCLTGIVPGIPAETGQEGAVSGAAKGFSYASALAQLMFSIRDDLKGIDRKNKWSERVAGRALRSLISNMSEASNPRSKLNTTQEQEIRKSLAHVGGQATTFTSLDVTDFISALGLPNSDEDLVGTHDHGMVSLLDRPVFTKSVFRPAKGTKMSITVRNPEDLKEGETAQFVWLLVDKPNHDSSKKDDSSNTTTTDPTSAADPTTEFDLSRYELGDYTFQGYVMVNDATNHHIAVVKRPPNAAANAVMHGSALDAFGTENYGGDEDDDEDRDQEEDLISENTGAGPRTPGLGGSSSQAYSGGYGGASTGAYGDDMNTANMRSKPSAVLCDEEMVVSLPPEDSDWAHKQRYVAWMYPDYRYHLYLFKRLPSEDDDEDDADFGDEDGPGPLAATRSGAGIPGDSDGDNKNNRGELDGLRDGNRHNDFDAHQGDDLFGVDGDDGTGAPMYKPPPKTEEQIFLEAVQALIDDTEGEALLMQDRKNFDKMLESDDPEKHAEVRMRPMPQSMRQNSAAAGSPPASGNNSTTNSNALAGSNESGAFGGRQVSMEVSESPQRGPIYIHTKGCSIIFFVTARRVAGKLARVDIRCAAWDDNLKRFRLVGIYSFTVAAYAGTGNDEASGLPPAGANGVRSGFVTSKASAGSPVRKEQQDVGNSEQCKERALIRIFYLVEEYTTNPSAGGADEEGTATTKQLLLGGRPASASTTNRSSEEGPEFSDREPERSPGREGSSSKRKRVRTQEPGSKKAVPTRGNETDDEDGLLGDDPASPPPGEDDRSKVIELIDRRNARDFQENYRPGSARSLHETNQDSIPENGDFDEFFIRHCVRILNHKARTQNTALRYRVIFLFRVDPKDENSGCGFKIIDWCGSVMGVIPTETLRGAEILNFASLLLFFRSLIVSDSESKAHVLNKVRNQTYSTLRSEYPHPVERDQRAKETLLFQERVLDREAFLQRHPPSRRRSGRSSNATQEPSDDSIRDAREDAPGFFDLSVQKNLKFFTEYCLNYLLCSPYRSPDSGSFIDTHHDTIARFKIARRTTVLDGCGKLEASYFISALFACVATEVSGTSFTCAQTSQFLSPLFSNKQQSPSITCVKTTRRLLDRMLRSGMPRYYPDNTFIVKRNHAQEYEYEPHTWGPRVRRFKTNDSIEGELRVYIFNKTVSKIGAEKQRRKSLAASASGSQQQRQQANKELSQQSKEIQIWPSTVLSNQVLPPANSNSAASQFQPFPMLETYRDTWSQYDGIIAVAYPHPTPDVPPSRRTCGLVWWDNSSPQIRSMTAAQLGSAIKSSMKSLTRADGSLLREEYLSSPEASPVSTFIWKCGSVDGIIPTRLEHVNWYKRVLWSCSLGVDPTMTLGESLVPAEQQQMMMQSQYNNERMSVVDANNTTFDERESQSQARSAMRLRPTSAGSTAFGNTNGASASNVGGRPVSALSRASVYTTNEQYSYETAEERVDRTARRLDQLTHKCEENEISREEVDELMTTFSKCQRRKFKATSEAYDNILFTWWGFRQEEKKAREYNMSSSSYFRPHSLLTPEICAPIARYMEKTQRLGKVLDKISPPKTLISTSFLAVVIGLLIFNALIYRPTLATTTDAIERRVATCLNPYASGTNTPDAFYSFLAATTSADAAAGDINIDTKNINARFNALTDCGVSELTATTLMRVEERSVGLSQAFVPGLSNAGIWPLSASTTSDSSTTSRRRQAIQHQNAAVQQRSFDTQSTCTIASDCSGNAASVATESNGTCTCTCKDFWQGSSCVICPRRYFTTSGCNACADHFYLQGTLKITLPDSVDLTNSTVQSMLAVLLENDFNGMLSSRSTTHNCGDSGILNVAYITSVALSSSQDFTQDFQQVDAGFALRTYDSNCDEGMAARTCMKTYLENSCFNLRNVSTLDSTRLSAFACQPITVEVPTGEASTTDLAASLSAPVNPCGTDNVAPGDACETLQSGVQGSLVATVDSATGAITYSTSTSTTSTTTSTIVTGTCAGPEAGIYERTGLFVSFASSSQCSSTGRNAAGNRATLSVPKALYFRTPVTYIGPNGDTSYDFVATEVNLDWIMEAHYDEQQDSNRIRRRFTMVFDHRTVAQWDLNGFGFALFIVLILLIFACCVISCYVYKYGTLFTSKFPQQEETGNERKSITISVMSPGGTSSGAAAATEEGDALNQQEDNQEGNNNSNMPTARRLQPMPWDCIFASFLATMFSIVLLFMLSSIFRWRWMDTGAFGPANPGQWAYLILLVVVMPLATFALGFHVILFVRQTWRPYRAEHSDDALQGEDEGASSTSDPFGRTTMSRPSTAGMRPTAASTIYFYRLLPVGTFELLTDLVFLCVEALIVGCLIAVAVQVARANSIPFSGDSSFPAGFGWNHGADWMIDSYSLIQLTIVLCSFPILRTVLITPTLDGVVGGFGFCFVIALLVWIYVSRMVKEATLLLIPPRVDSPPGLALLIALLVLFRVYRNRGGATQVHRDVQDYIARDYKGLKKAAENTIGWRIAAAVMFFFLLFTIFAAILYPYFIGDVPTVEFSRIGALGSGQGHLHSPRGVMGRNDVAWLWRNILGFY